MTLWKCSSCGYELPSHCHPKECPQCKGPKENFTKSVVHSDIKKATLPKKTQKKIVNKKTGKKVKGK